MDCLIILAVPDEATLTIHNLFRSSHKVSSVLINRHPVRIFQLLDRLHKLACNPSPWNLRKCKVTAANVPVSLVPAVICFVFFELKCVFPRLEKPKPAFYLESNLNVQSLPARNWYSYCSCRKGESSHLKAML
jgi:hypothetical protein